MLSKCHVYQIIVYFLLVIHALILSNKYLTFKYFTSLESPIFGRLDLLF